METTKPAQDSDPSGHPAAEAYPPMVAGAGRHHHGELRPPTGLPGIEAVGSIALADVPQDQPAGGADAFTDQPEAPYNRISNRPGLTAEQEVELAKRIEAGLFATHILETGTFVGNQEIVHNLKAYDPNELRELAKDYELAKLELFEANLRLVVYLAKRYHGLGMQFQDIVQEGNIALLHACNRFDYTKGRRFSTYATRVITGGILRAMANQARTIRKPEDVIFSMLRMAKTRPSLTSTLGREPTIAEIAAQLGCSPERVIFLAQAARAPLSLDTPLDSLDPDITIYGILRDPNEFAVDDYMQLVLLKGAIEEALSCLDPAQASAIEMYFGLDGSAPKTQKEIALMNGISQQAAQQRIAAGLRRLTESDKLRSYYKES